MNKTLEQRVAEVSGEAVEIVPYNPAWQQMFAAEAAHLRRVLPADLIGRIEHFCSTAVPGLAAKPIVDMLVEVASLEKTKEQIVPILTAQGYDYFWRPPFGDDAPPQEWYAWFIKRDDSGKRTHHIHMVEADSKLWERLRFRDHLRAHPDVARRYTELKIELVKKFKGDRFAYTRGKEEFILELMGSIDA
jgi:GrpB-like predicted nucleotidyltransferase (UPF0157 family)